MKFAIFAAVLIVLFASHLEAQQPQPVRVRCFWSAPTTGGPVETYTLVVYQDGNLVGTYEGLTDTTITFNDTDNQYPLLFVPWAEYLARVQAQNQAGTSPWSDWGAPFVFDPGVPGVTGATNWEILGDPKFSSN